MPFDPWKLGSGLIDDVDVHIEQAFFTNPSDYNNGETLVMMFEGTADGEEWNQFYPCGDGWETPDQGRTARRADGKEKNFNKNCGYGLWIGNAIGLVPDSFRTRGTPMMASLWNDTTWHVGRIEIKGRGDIPDREVLVPNAFKGLGNTAGANGNPGAANPSAAPTAVPAAAAPNTANPAVAAPVAPSAVAGAASTPTGLSPAILGRLKAMAKTATSWEGFVEAAYTSIPECSTDPAVEAAVMDSGPTSLYTTSK